MKNKFVGDAFVIGEKYEITGLQVSEDKPCIIINHHLGRVDLKKITATQAQQLEEKGCDFIQKYEPPTKTVPKEPEKPSKK